MECVCSPAAANMKKEAGPFPEQLAFFTCERQSTTPVALKMPVRPPRNAEDHLAMLMFTRRAGPSGTGHAKVAWA